MPAGSIVVELMAKTGSFDTDIDRTTKATEKRMKAMQQTMAQAGAAIGLSMAAVGAAVIYAAKQAIDGLDKLNDVADATGASIENISALEDVALRTGNSFESVEAALLKFNLALKGSDDDGKAARALEAIGLNVEELRRLDPAEALRQTAVALAQFADDGDKARLVQELFGKSVREVGPFLKDLAEKGQLVATVTTEQAKAAETFNKQLAEMAKNSTDVRRALVGDLVTAINEAAKALKESGLIEGFRTLFTGSDQFKNDKRLVELTDQLLQAENALSMSRAKDSRFGDRSLETAANEKRLAGLKAELATVQAYQKLLQGGAGLGPPAAGALPSVGPMAAKAPKGPKGPDPDADFKSYLDNLEKQIQKVDDLTVSEKLLDDIRRGSLTVSAQQQEQLAGLAQRVDKEKEWAEVVKEGRAAEIARGEAVKKSSEEYQALLDRLLNAGPAAQLEKQRKEMELLADAFLQGRINADQFNDAVTGALNLVAEKAPEAKSMTEELGLTFASAFEEAVLGGGKLSDVFKGLLQDIARVILRMGVMEPMMKQLKESMSGGGSTGGGMWGSLFSAAASAFAGGGGGGGGYDIGANYGGFRAEGGPVSPGKSYMVGERGPEMFVPRTAGMVVPNNAMGAGGNLSIINQTTGRVDSVVEQQISPTQRALILQEGQKLTAAQLANQNSDLSRAMRQNFNVRPSRS